MPVRQLESTIQRMGSDRVTSIHQYISTCKKDVPTCRMHWTRAWRATETGAKRGFGLHFGGERLYDHSQTCSVSHDPRLIRHIVMSSKNVVPTISSNLVLCYIVVAG
jgi:hypothetical protein